MPDTNIRDTLLSHLTQANGDIQKLRDNVAVWFDGAMERVSGVYKRHLKHISFVVGMIVVLALNADTLKVARALWNDAPLRTAMVQSASNMLVQKPEGKPQQATNVLDVIKDDQQVLRPLPLGWSAASIPAELSLGIIGIVLAKLVGLLMSALAVSLGAPFWFDLLAMFMQIRGTRHRLVASIGESVTRAWASCSRSSRRAWPGSAPSSMLWS